MMLTERRFRISLSSLAGLFSLAGTLMLAACGTSQPSATEPSDLSGPELAKTYCGSCHQFPEPGLLPRHAWEQGVLPKMAWRLGITATDTASTIYAQMDEQEHFQKGVRLGVFPAEPVLHSEDWLKIVKYYLENAPTELKDSVAAPIATELPLFSILRPAQHLPAQTTALRFDSARSTIWIGGRSGSLLGFSPKLEQTRVMGQTSSISDVHVRPDGRLDVLTMGIMDPNDDSLGAWQSIRVGGPMVVRPVAAGAKAGETEDIIAVKKLHRPVHTAYGDLNRDGREDVIICQFGNLTGKLSWYENTTKGYEERLIDPVPGARVTLVRDLNGDGWPDLLALLAQGDEQVAAYYNLQNGRFRKKTLLHFPSVYGSSYLEMADVDRDGDEDLVYANGDNADFSYALKPYHGVRIFLNDGKFNFRQSTFYPLHGATQTLTRDFDGDGDLDIAAIAFFPDPFAKVLRGFVYLENTGKLTFTPRTLPELGNSRWLTMEAADIDRDGDEDLLLGAYYQALRPLPPGLNERWQQAEGLTVLVNQRR